MNIEHIVPLLGKSELDEQVKAMLTVFDVKQPLPRAERDMDQVNIALPKSFRMEFCFCLAESLGKPMNDNTDYALWHFQKCTLSILYSHLDNRILRISMYAPGVWQSFKSRRASWSSS